MWTWCLTLETISFFSYCILYRIFPLKELLRRIKRKLEKMSHIYHTYIFSHYWTQYDRSRWFEMSIKLLGRWWWSGRMSWGCCDWNEDEHIMLFLDSMTPLDWRPLTWLCMNGRREEEGERREKEKKKGIFRAGMCHRQWWYEYLKEKVWIGRVTMERERIYIIYILYIYIYTIYLYIIYLYILYMYIPCLFK